MKDNLKLLTSLFLVSSFLFANGLMGVDYKPIQDGPTHEAYVTAVKGTDFLDAVPNAPPKEITETIPAKRDQESDWISGYWAWDNERDDFLWVSGVWRRPPPGHQWIEGYWEQFDDGWVWIRGFWSQTPENRLTYINKAPPDAPDENPGSPPGKEFFWNSGYWHYTVHNDKYTWVIGAWEPIDPNWILVPAHYVWRPDGYTFIPAYWDWPFDDRGRAYSCIWIDPGARDGFIYQPAVIIEPIMVIRHLFCCYPDYWCYFYHHHHFHPEFWDEFYGTPPWWGWPEWWCYSWGDTWGLWWWWCHPGYPQPWWIDAQFAGLLYPPPGALVALFNGLIPPIFITPEGLVFPADILNAIAQLLNGDGPIIPLNQQLRDQIQDKVEPKKGIEKILKPSGKRLPPGSIPPVIKKPEIDPNALDGISVDRTRTPPPPLPGGRIVPPRRDRPEIRPVPPRATTPERPGRRPPRTDRPGRRPPQWERPENRQPPQWERPGGRRPPQWERPERQQPPQWERPGSQYPPGGGINIPDIIDQIREHGDRDRKPPSRDQRERPTYPGQSEINPGQTRRPPTQSSPNWMQQNRNMRQNRSLQMQRGQIQWGPRKQQQQQQSQRRGGSSSQTWQGEFE